MRKICITPSKVVHFCFNISLQTNCLEMKPLRTLAPTFLFSWQLCQRVVPVSRGYGANTEVSTEKGGAREKAILAF